MKLFINQLEKFKSELAEMDSMVAKEELFGLISKFFECEDCDTSCFVDDDNLFQSILDNIPIPVYYKNTKGVYLACNNALGELYGLPRNEIAGRTAYDFFPKVVADGFAESDKKLLEERTKTSAEYHGDRSGKGDGFHVIYKTVFIRNGEVDGIIGVITDFTEHKMMEDRAWASEAFFKSLFERSPLPLVLVNSLGFIVDLNTTAANFFFCSDTLAGQEFSNIFCTYGDFEKVFKSDSDTQRVMIYNSAGEKQEVVAMRSSSELNGELFQAVAFVRTDI